MGAFQLSFCLFAVCAEVTRVDGWPLKSTGFSALRHRTASLLLRARSAESGVWPQGKFCLYSWAGLLHLAGRGLRVLDALQGRLRVPVATGHSLPQPHVITPHVLLGLTHNLLTSTRYQTRSPVTQGAARGGSCPCLLSPHTHPEGHLCRHPQEPPDCPLPDLCSGPAVPGICGCCLLLFLPPLCNFRIKSLRSLSLLQFLKQNK